MNGLRKTLENVRDIVKGIPNVQDVFIGDIYDNLNANQSVCYPAGVISKGDMRMDFQNKRIYTTLNIFLCDRETDDKSNKLQVQSWATSALYQITKSLNKSKFYIPQETVQVKTFEERFGSVAAGAFLTCEVFTPMSECETLDWGTPAPPPESSIKGLQFKAILDDMDVYLRQYGTWQPSSTPKLVYTYDGLEWKDWDFVNNEPIHIKEGHSMWVRAKEHYTKQISSESGNYRNFDFVGEGLIMCYNYVDYLHGENFEDRIYGRGDFSQLFRNNKKLVKAPDIARTHHEGDYYSCANMFNGCTAMVIGPKVLHATVPGSYMWRGMFYGCTALLETPEIIIDYNAPGSTRPGEYMCNEMFTNCYALKTIHWNVKINNTNPTQYCFNRMFANCIGLEECNFTLDNIKFLDNSMFRGMFDGCTSLKTAPRFAEHYGLREGTAIPSHQLDKMFYGCTSLENTSDAIVIDKFGEGTCYQMFEGCTALKISPELITDEIGTTGCYHMFYGCKGLETAQKITGETIGTSGCVGMFEGCTNLVDAGFDIDANVVGEKGYNRMFYGCTKLEIAPRINATEIGLQGCEYMFYNCYELTDVQDTLPAMKLGSAGYRYMFQNCKALTTAPEIMVEDLTILGGNTHFYAMFTGCISLTDVQDKLYPTTLTTNCYYQMFDGCTVLTKTPELPATTGVSGCYNYMFRNTKVNRIKCLLNGNISTNYTTNWVTGVSGTIRDGLFIKHPNATWPAAGASSIPVNWTVINDGDDIIVNLDQTATEFTTKYDGLQVDQVNINYPLSTIGRWMGLCLPFDLNNNELKDIFGDNYELVEYRTGDTKFDFNDDDGTPHITLPNNNDVTEVVAGKPYMVKPSKVVSSITATDKVIKSTIYTTIIEKDNWVMKLSGDFVKKDIPKSDAATHTWYFALNGGQWQYTGQIVPLNGYRVSFIISPKDTINAAPPGMLMKAASPKASNPLDDLDTTLLTFLTEHGLENEYIKYITEQ